MKNKNRVQPCASVKPRHLTGGMWKRRKLSKGKGSQTPGSAKVHTCQLTSIGGLPRKAFMRSRSYKYREYSAWIKFQDQNNGGAK